MGISKNEAGETEMQTYRVAITDGDASRIIAFQVPESQVEAVRQEARAHRAHSSEWITVAAEDN